MAPSRARLRQVQTITWGALIIWVGVLLGTDVTEDRPGLTIFVLGVIFFVSGVAQRMAAKREGGGFMFAGAVMTGVGANDLFGDGTLSIAAIVVILIGVAIVLSAFRPSMLRVRVGGSDADEAS